jgi:multidrug efflux pump subunit AcrA (membrane-fusion protein)
MFKKFGAAVKAHKVITLVAFVVVVGGGYYWYTSTRSGTTVTKYVVQNATQGTIVASVTASGQVNPVTDLNVNPQVSETVTKVYVRPGDRVTAGEPLVQLDTTNEQKALTQAQLSLQSAQLNLQEMQQVTTSTLLSDQDSVTKAERTMVSASTSLAQDYVSGFSALSSAFIDFQNVMTALNDFVTGHDISKTQANPDAYVSLMPNYLQGSTLPYRDTVDEDYNAALAAYQQNLLDYHATSANASPATLDALFSETYNTAEAISATVKASKDLLNYVVNNYPQGEGFQTLPTITTTFQSNMGSYTNTVDGDVSGISGAITNITNDKNSIVNDQLSLSEASETLATLLGGPDPLQLQGQQISIENAQLSLQTAQQNLADCTIRAPIGGIVATVSAIAGENVPSPAVTIVGSGNEADVTLNEVDAAKVSLGDQATLTFDALSNVSLAGQVVEIDPVGTVSQGVVNYNVKIDFTQPANTSSTNLVKPSMTVTAAIVTQADQNVIAVPNSAITTVGGQSYVLEPATPVSADQISASATGGIALSAAPKRVPVTTGLSNDTMTEITSGVNVGDQIITQTLTTSASTGSSGSGAGAGGLRLGGGGATILGGGGGGGFTGGGARGTVNFSAGK